MGDQASGGNQLMNQTNSVLQFAGRKYGVNQAPKHKAYLARHTLAQLLENGMIPAAFMPVAKNRHLAWTSGFVCRARPSSMVQAIMGKNQHLVG
jgi:hypothetical protein